MQAQRLQHAERELGVGPGKLGEGFFASHGRSAAQPVRDGVFLQSWLLRVSEASVWVTRFCWHCTWTRAHVTFELRTRAHHYFGRAHLNTWHFLAAPKYSHSPADAPSADADGRNATAESELCVLQASMVGGGHGMMSCQPRTGRQTDE